MTTANRTTNHPATAAAELRAMAARIEAGESVCFLAIEQAADGSASVQAIGIEDAHRLAGLALRLAVGAVGGAQA